MGGGESWTNCSLKCTLYILNIFLLYIVYKNYQHCSIVRKPLSLQWPVLRDSIVLLFENFKQIQWCMYFRPKHILYSTSDLSYIRYTTLILARGFTDVSWTYGRSAWPPCPSLLLRSAPLSVLAAALGPEIVF